MVSDRTARSKVGTERAVHVPTVAVEALNRLVEQPRGTPRPRPVVEESDDSLDVNATDESRQRVRTSSVQSPPWRTKVEARRVRR